MKTIIKTFLFTLLLVASLNAKENFSEMSTQELIAIMGYVKTSDSDTFNKELKSRVPSMSASEKKKYEKNTQKVK